MFSTKERLNKRTPKQGIDRGNYINLLAGEFYETSTAEAKEQVSANLANFAYDPINYEYLKESNVLDIFLQLIVSGNNKLILHGITGICNFCLDPDIKQSINQSDSIELIINLISNLDTEIVLNAITTIIFILDDSTKSKIINEENINKFFELSNSNNPRIKTLANLFLIDYCPKDLHPGFKQ